MVIPLALCFSCFILYLFLVLFVSYPRPYFPFVLRFSLVSLYLFLAFVYLLCRMLFGSTWVLFLEFVSALAFCVSFPCLMFVVTFFSLSIVYQVLDILYLVLWLCVSFLSSCIPCQFRSLVVVCIGSWLFCIVSWTYLYLLVGCDGLFRLLSLVSLWELCISLCQLCIFSLFLFLFVWFAGGGDVG